VPAIPVLIPCFKELDSRLQKDGVDEKNGLPDGGSVGLEDAMQRIIFAQS
jgi:hypothetical protein